MRTPNKTRLYESLGQIVISFRALEHGVDEMILGSLESPAAQGAILIENMSFPQKMKVMDELIRSLHTEQELGTLHHTLEALLERGLACEQQRNDWLHSYWVPEVESEPGAVMRLERAVNASELTLMSVNIIELENFVVVLNATLAYLCGLHQKLANNFNRIRHSQAAEYLAVKPRLIGRD